MHNIITDSIENAHYDLIHVRFVLHVLADHRATHAFNLSLIMRQLLGAGTPRGFVALCRTLRRLFSAVEATLGAVIDRWITSVSMPLSVAA
ncbi:MAG: hypothetical protein O2782_00795 [bacterium]|nr:hypothetical protein [bacterium]